MFSMHNFSNFDSYDECDDTQEENITHGSKESNSIEVDDIVAIPVCYGALCQGSNEHATLRLLAVLESDYVCLVTPCDRNIMSRSRLDAKKAREWNIPDRFVGDEFLLVDKSSVKLHKKQRGSFCKKCLEYTSDVERDFDYYCASCRINPWR